MPISTTIDSTRTIESNSGDDKFTVYQITVRGDFNQICHTVDRRYREFESLHNRLSSLLPVPHLPRKVLLHRRSTKIIEQRRQLLEVYLNEILKQCQKQSIMPDDLARFLQLPPYDTEQQQSVLRKDDQLENMEDDGDLTLKHAPCISITDYRPWNNDHRELFSDSILTGLMHSMYDM